MDKIIRIQETEATYDLAEKIVGDFDADVFVNDSLMVELKAIQNLAKAHEVQLMNYLTATGVDEDLLLNFGADRLQFKKKFRLLKSDTVSL